MIQDDIQNLNFFAKVFHPIWIVISAVFSNVIIQYLFFSLFVFRKISLEKNVYDGLQGLLVKETNLK